MSFSGCPQPTAGVRGQSSSDRPGWNSGGQSGTDSVGDPALAAVFQSLPGASFLHRQRRANPKASALTSAGAQLFITAQWSLLAKFDGEFAQGAQSYASSARLRYTW